MATDIRKPKGDIDDFWDEFDWDDLSAEEQKAFAVLGWDQKSWDNDINVPAANKDWADLSPRERSALKALGYDEEYWDS